MIQDQSRWDAKKFELVSIAGVVLGEMHTTSRKSFTHVFLWHFLVGDLNFVLFNVDRSAVTNFYGQYDDFSDS